MTRLILALAAAGTALAVGLLAAAPAVAAPRGDALTVRVRACDSRVCTPHWALPDACRVVGVHDLRGGIVLRRVCR